MTGEENPEISTALALLAVEDPVAAGVETGMKAFRRAAAASGPASPPAGTTSAGRSTAPSTYAARSACWPPAATGSTAATSSPPVGTATALEALRARATGPQTSL